MMNNPNQDREHWLEFTQEMQNWALRVADVAEDNGWDYIGGAPFSELIEWTELRYLDGQNCLKPEDEYTAYREYIDESDG